MAHEDDVIEQVRRERDPIDRARLAGELIRVNQQRGVELARLRKEAINAAAAAPDMSFRKVADLLGLTTGRISQIRKSAPPSERAFFGMGPVTVAVPLREMPGRPLPVISSEDERARRELADLLTSLTFTVEPFQIPTSGEWEPPAGDVVAICGPGSSRVTAEALDSDPVLVFDQDPVSGLWTIGDRVSGERWASPMDQPDASMAPNEWADIAYVGRLAYRGRKLLIVAGVHALGSAGAVHFLREHLPEVYAEVDADRFSMVVRSEHSGETVVRSELVCPPRRHL